MASRSRTLPHGGLRCPLCHGALGRERLHACAGCATPFHAGCWRELGGCSTLGCPEAGRAAVVEEARKAAPAEHAPHGSIALAVAGVLIGWIAGVFSAFLALAVVATGVLPLALARRRRATLVSLALSPAALPLVSAAKALLGYVTGSAAFLTVGLMAGPAPLDPVVRCRVRSTGCVVSGFDALWNVPNNLTLRALGAVFGPMRGAYDGPLPDQSEALAALATAEPVTVPEHTFDDMIEVGGRAVTLPAGTLLRLEACYARRDGEGRCAPLRVALIDGRAVVFGDEHDPSRGPSRASLDPSLDRCVFVIDAETGVLLARHGPR